MKLIMLLSLIGISTVLHCSQCPLLYIDMETIVGRGSYPILTPKYDSNIDAYLNEEMDCHKHVDVYDDFGNYMGFKDIEFKSPLKEVDDYKAAVIKMRREVFEQRQKLREFECKYKNPGDLSNEEKECQEKFHQKLIEYDINIPNKKSYNQFKTIKNKIKAIAVKLAKKRNVTTLNDIDNTVLYVKPECDITSDVIEIANKEYLIRKTKSCLEMCLAQ